MDKLLKKKKTVSFSEVNEIFRYEPDSQTIHELSNQKAKKHHQTQKRWPSFLSMKFNLRQKPTKTYKYQLKPFLKIIL